MLKAEDIAKETSRKKYPILFSKHGRKCMSSFCFLLLKIHDLKRCSDLSCLMSFTNRVVSQDSWNIDLCSNQDWIKLILEKTNQKLIALKVTKTKFCWKNRG